MPSLRTLLLAATVLLTGCDPPVASVDLEKASLHDADGTRVSAFGDQYPRRSGYAIEAVLDGVPADAAGVHWFVYVSARKEAMAYHLAERPPYRYPADKLDELPLGGPHRLVAQVWNAKRETIANAEKEFRVVHVPSLAKVADPVGELDPDAPLFRLLPYAQHGKSVLPSAPVGARFTLPDGREISTGDADALEAWREGVKKRYGGDPWMETPKSRKAEKPK